MIVWGSIIRYGKMVLPPPQLPPPLHYLIGLGAKNFLPSMLPFHASTTTSSPLLLVLIMPLINLYDYIAFLDPKMVWGPSKFLKLEETGSNLKKIKRKCYADYVCVG